MPINRKKDTSTVVKMPELEGAVQIASVSRLSPITVPANLQLPQTARRAFISDADLADVGREA